MASVKISELTEVVEVSPESNLPIVQDGNTRRVNVANLLRSVPSQAVAAVGATNPEASPGLLWWNSEDGELYIYYNDGTSNQWVTTNSNDDAPLLVQHQGNTVFTDPTTINFVGSSVEASESNGVVTVAYSDSPSQWLKIANNTVLSPLSRGVLANTATDLTVTLPLASTTGGFWFQNLGPRSLTIATTGGELINQSNNLVLSFTNSTVRLVSTTYGYLIF